LCSRAITVSSRMILLHEHINLRVKVKLPLYLSKHHSLWESGVSLRRIINIATRSRWKGNDTVRPLYLWGMILWYPLVRRLGGPQSRFGHCGEEKNLCPLKGIEHCLLGRTARNQLTMRCQLFHDYKTPANQNGCQK
jgi:hypothetical protein